MLKSIITWSEMGKQTAQAKEVYSIIYLLLRQTPANFSLESSLKQPLLRVIVILK